MKGKKAQQQSGQHESGEQELFHGKLLFEMVETTF